MAKSRWLVTANTQQVSVDDGRTDTDTDISPLEAAASCLFGGSPDQRAKRVA